jgi:hypothetical protein
MAEISEDNYLGGAILIGFNYQDYQSLGYLPGIIIDLYIMYRYCRDILHIPDCQIKIITDITKRDDPLVYAMVQGIVDQDILTFVQDIIIPRNLANRRPDNLNSTNTVTNSNNRYNSRPTLTTIDNNLSYYTQIQNALKYFNNQDNNYINNLLFYYTGHGTDGHLNFPGKHTLSLVLLRDMIFDTLSVDVKIYLLLDCCHLSGAEFPYKYNQKHNYLELHNNDIIPEHDCILIISCNLDNRAATSINGSIFTRNLINFFKSEDRSLYSLSNKLLSTSEIYTTYSNSYYPNSWIFGAHDFGKCVIHTSYLEILS